jgi:anhydro-N-acetylmuramic acid kinase
MRVAGIMSGTSLDGIDVAVVDIEGRRIDVVAYHSTPYSDKVRNEILAVSNTNTHTAAISRLNFSLADLYAKAVRKCGPPLSTIELVGCHGQTVYHELRSTLQLGDGSVLAEKLGVPVVSDFRTRDMAAGGKGAPLVPFVDLILYADPKLGRVALNIGGIANITAIPPGGKAHGVIAFDTGPGNMVIDQLVAIHTHNRRKYDSAGQLAAKGNVNDKLLNSLLRRAYYRQSPPKAAGREQYGQEFVRDLILTELPMLDLIATATALTPATIAMGVQKFIPYKVDEVIVSGGGVHNRTMMKYLQTFLPDVRLRRSNEFGIDGDAKEAIAFAILAYETWHRRPSNLPSATGARRPVVLGKVSY